MKTTHRSSLLLALLALTLSGSAWADQSLPGSVTITGGTASGNLTVTGNGSFSGTLAVIGMIDSNANDFGFGTQGASLGANFHYANSDADTFTFFLNRTPGSWLWQHGTTAAARLDATHKLSLYQADGVTVGASLDPVLNVLTLGGATLTRDSTGALVVGGALTVNGTFSAPTYTSTGGALTGGATGLTLNAGGTNQNITLAPSGTGVVTTNSRLVVNNTTTATSATTGALVVGSNVGLSGNAGGDSYFGGNINISNTAGNPYLQVRTTQAGGNPAVVWTSGFGGTPQSWGAYVNYTGTDGTFTIRDLTAGYNPIVISKGYTQTVTFNGAVEATTAGAGTIVAKGGIFAAGKIIGSEHDLSGGASITGTAGALALTAAGTNQNITLSPSGTGNVGIGTTAPTAMLDVNGTVLIEGSSGSLSFVGRNGFVTTVPSDANPFIYSSARYPGDGSGAFPFNNYGETIFQGNPRTSYNGGFSFMVGQGAVGTTLTPSLALRISEAGNVGIGTRSPAAKLDVAGNANISGNLTVGGTFSAANYATTGNAAVTGQTTTGTLAVGSNATIAGSTASTSTTTGALQVSGGVGVGGAIYAGSLQNTPIGSITPNTGAFTTLSATGNLRLLTNNTAIYLYDNTSTANGFIYMDSSNRLQINQSEPNGSLWLTSNGGSGHVKIGDQTSVASNAYVADFSVTGLSIGTTTDATTGGAGSLTTAGGIYAAKSVVIAGTTASTSPTTGSLVTAGGLGVGGGLNVSGGVGIAGNLTVGGTFSAANYATSGNAAVTGQTTTGTLAVGSNATIAGSLTAGSITASGGATITGPTAVTGNLTVATGNVGIGTTAPGSIAKLAVQGVSSTDTTRMGVAANDYLSTPTFTASFIQQNGNSATGTTSGVSSAGLGQLFFQNTSAGLIWTNGGAPLVFGTLSSERMRIDFTGNVGIGTTAPVAKLEVAGTLRVSGKAPATFTGAVLLAPQGDISMGDFTTGTQPQ